MPLFLLNRRKRHAGYTLILLSFSLIKREQREYVIYV
jgi:hypothetical protein